MATATKVIGGLAAKLADLRGQRADLAAEAEQPSPVEQVDQEIEAASAELQAAQEAANYKRLIELRRKEKAQMERVIAAIDPLWDEIVALDAIHREQHQVARAPAILAVIPAHLVHFLKPGWEGGRRHWAHVKRFANFEYTK